jgi:hypothetical protein
MIACIRAVESSTCKKPVYSATIYHHHNDDDDEEEDIMLCSQKFSNSQVAYLVKL